MQTIAQSITLYLSGFTIISSLILALTHLRADRYQDKQLPRLAGFVLLFGLAAIQASHVSFFRGNDTWIHSEVYLVMLFSVSPAFYFTIRDILKVESHFQVLHVLHVLPLLIGLLSPRKYALLLAFFTGTGYVLWLAFSVYSLRAQRSRFKLELIALLAMAIVAFSVLLLGVALPIISELFFYTTYAFLLGCGFIVVVYTLLRFPDITDEVVEAVQATYAISTLKNVDSESLTTTLRQLLEVDKIYTNETLSLSSLSEQMNISTHQLSELINTRFDKSFSHLIREYRVKEAQRMLLDEPKASVLSIGLSTGFTSQSNFYTAFREITGMAPGNYRKSQKSK